MEAKELRIGNYVTIAHETNSPLARVESITGQFINVFDNQRGYDIDFVLRIPINQEWLIRLGFIHQYGDIWDMPKPCESINYNHGECDVYAGERHSYECQMITDSVKHVHQLQNLYFALTGEELEVKND